MFLSTLNISSQMVNVALANNVENIGISAIVTKPRNPIPSRGFKWSQADQDVLDHFFREIPKAPGHCRKDLSKIYLTKIVPTMKKLYNIYKMRCGALNFLSTSTKIIIPCSDGKKICVTCIGYEEGTVEVNYFTEHQTRKNEGFALKEKDKKKGGQFRHLFLPQTPSHYF